MYYDYEKVGYQSPNGALGEDILGRGSGYQSDSHPLAGLTTTVSLPMGITTVTRHSKLA